MGSAWANGDCPCCKHGRFDHLEGKAGSSATALCGRDAVQLTHRQTGPAVNLDEIAGRLEKHGEVKHNEFMVRAEINDNGSAYEITLFPDGRAIVKGTGEEKVARSLYSKYVGN